MDAEAGDDLVEDQSRAQLAGELPQAVEELPGLEVGAAALHGLDQHGREIGAGGAQQVEGRRVAVREDQEVVHEVRRHPRSHGDRMRIAAGATGAGEHAVEGAVIRAGEKRDPGAPRRRPRQAHGGHHGLGAGVAEGDPLEAGELGDSGGDLPRQLGLRSQLEPMVDPLSQRRLQELR